MSRLAPSPTTGTRPPRHSLRRHPRALPVALTAPARPVLRGFTLIELLVVIAIIAILAAFLFPVFARARENVKKTTCGSNMKQLLMGLAQYTSDNDEKLPIARTTYYLDALGQQFPASNSPGGVQPYQRQYWEDLIYPYLKNAQVYNDSNYYNQFFSGCTFYNGITCTASQPAWTSAQNYTGPTTPALDNEGGGSRNDRERLSYAVPQNMCDTPPYSLNKITAWPYVGNKILLGESDRYRLVTPNFGFGGELMPRHFNGVNIGFLDGHVKWLTWDTVAANPMDPNASEYTKELWLQVQ